ncbi:MAG: helix-turn-helix transcriptional regulator [Vicinamibacterales bacterium]
MSTPAIVPKRLLTEAEAACYLSLSRSTLRQQRMRGAVETHIPHIPYLHIGRLVRYDLATLDAWIAARWSADRR